MRLTGNVPSSSGPITELGRLVCKFIDIIEDDHLDQTQKLSSYRDLNGQRIACHSDAQVRILDDC